MKLIFKKILSFMLAFSIILSTNSIIFANEMETEKNMEYDNSIDITDENIDELLLSNPYLIKDPFALVDQKGTIPVPCMTVIGEKTGWRSIKTTVTNISNHPIDNVYIAIQFMTTTTTGKLEQNTVQRPMGTIGAGLSFIERFGFGALYSISSNYRIVVYGYVNGKLSVSTPVILPGNE